MLADHYKKKNKERIKNFKVTEDSRYIHQNELHKACFPHETAYGDFKDLTKRKASDKILRDKALSTVKNPKYDEYQRDLSSMIHKFFDKNTSSGVIKNENMSNKRLAEKLQKPIIRKSEKRKVHSSFIDNFLFADFSDMQLISTFIKGIRFSLCVSYVFSKCARVTPLKDTKVLHLLMLSKKF